MNTEREVEVQPHTEGIHTDIRDILYYTQHLKTAVSIES